MSFKINAEDLDYKTLNAELRRYLKEADSNRIGEVILKGVLGQRYIGVGLKDNVKIIIHGTPGNDMGAFMDGPCLEVFGNGQDGIGNTMNSGKIIIHGDGGDILGYSLRGGEIYIEKNVGFRCGIHMKSYRDKMPVIVIGGSAGNFLGEYMAGGIIIVLGMYDQDFSHFPYNIKSRIVGDFIGTGMHGGIIYIGKKVEKYKLGKEVKVMELDEFDRRILEKYTNNYCDYFEINKSKIPTESFIKLIPYSHRPYGKLYTY